MKKIEVPDEIAKDQGLQKLDKVEKIADKLKMNRTQVKGVLRGILETPDLFNFLMQQGIINLFQTKHTSFDLQETHSLHFRIDSCYLILEWLGILSDLLLFNYTYTCNCI